MANPEITADSACGSDGSIGTVVKGCEMEEVYVDVLIDDRVRVYARCANGYFFETVLEAPERYDDGEKLMARPPVRWDWMVVGAGIVLGFCLEFLVTVLLFRIGFLA